MPKRLAGYQLTHDNYDEEEKEDEGGELGIPRASDEMMKDRVIRVARRKAIAGASGAEPSKSAFTGFAGFGSLKPQTAFGAVTTTKSSWTKSEVKENGTKENVSKKSDQYYAKLRALNESVSAWIKQHVDKNPYCILTPVFRDYEKHLEGIEKLDKKDELKVVSSSVSDSKVMENRHVSFDLNTEKPADPVKTTESETVPPKSTFTFANTTPSATSVFSLGQKSESKSQSDTKILAPKFSLGAKTESEEMKTATSTNNAPKFSFSTSSIGGAASSGFSFGGMRSAADTGGVKPFSFATGSSTVNQASVSQASSGVGENDEEYVPPKPEVNEVKEDGALYSIRCKLFWHVDGAWKERGLGNLHLKQLESGKVQLVMRADTNLGNIILNIVLNDTVPISRSGKNMVNLVCIPNPPFDPKGESKPEKLLLKVKTNEDAEELFKQLEEAKAK